MRRERAGVPRYLGELPSQEWQNKQADGSNATMELAEGAWAQELNRTNVSWSKVGFATVTAVAN